MTRGLFQFSFLLRLIVRRISNSPKEPYKLVSIWRSALLILVKKTRPESPRGSGCYRTFYPRSQWSPCGGGTSRKSFAFRAFVHIPLPVSRSDSASRFRRRASGPRSEAPSRLLSGMRFLCLQPPGRHPFFVLRAAKKPVLHYSGYEPHFHQKEHRFLDRSFSNLFPYRCFTQLRNFLLRLSPFPISAIQHILRALFLLLDTLLLDTFCACASVVRCNWLLLILLFSTSGVCC